MNGDHVKLYIPGPIEVSEETYKAMSAPMIGHRSKDFVNLYEQIQPMLQSLCGTKQPVFLSTSSAWGVMEASIRNLVSKKVLNCCCGAFSDKWLDVSIRCGKQAESLQVEWGQPIDPAALEQKLSTGDFDTVTLVHNETSTGVANPLSELAAVVKKFPEVILVVDTVSSFSAVPISVDDLGIDVLLTGSQKALALPPGLSLFTVSEKAMARASEMPDRGYYFDFLEFEKNALKSMTPSTPCISLLHGLAWRLEQIRSEGETNRYARHEKLNAMVHKWVKDNGFEHFAPEGYRSKTLTCVLNNREIDVPGWIRSMREKHSLVINGGYGKIKGKTFRISNMGDETEESISAMLEVLSDTLPN